MPEPEQTVFQQCPSCGTDLDVSSLLPLENVRCPSCGARIRVREQIQNFVLQEMLAIGGMGVIYRALDASLNRPLALKVIRKEFSGNREYLDKFETEARITAAVNHPNVVKVFSFGADGGLYYIAMELADKGSLDQLVTSLKHLGEMQTLDIGIQIAKGLDAAFQAGLIHRDVKPDNILFSNDHTAKIVDFGLAVLMRSLQDGMDGQPSPLELETPDAPAGIPKRGSIWGTPYYAAPEKLSKGIEDFRGDMYSLGATLFYALTGRPPFEGETASQVAQKHLSGSAVDIQASFPEISSFTAAAINRMLSINPDERHQSYEELIGHLTFARKQLTDRSARPRQPKNGFSVREEELTPLTVWTTLGMLGLLGVLVIVTVALFIARYSFMKGEENIVRPTAPSPTVAALGKEPVTRPNPAATTIIALTPTPIPTLTPPPNAIIWINFNLAGKQHVFLSHNSPAKGINLPGGVWQKIAEPKSPDLELSGTDPALQVESAGKAPNHAGWALSLSSSGSWQKPNRMRIRMDLAFPQESKAGGVGLGFFSEIPSANAIKTGKDSGKLIELLNFTGILVKEDGSVSLYEKGIQTQSMQTVRTSVIKKNVFYHLSYSVDINKGSAFGIRFNGDVDFDTKITSFTDAATAYAGFIVSGTSGQVLVENFSIADARY